MYRIERKVDVQLTEKEILALHREHEETTIYWRIKGDAPKDTPDEEIEKAVDEVMKRLASRFGDLRRAEIDNAVASLIVNSEVRHGEQK